MTPRSLNIDLSKRFGGASARALGILGGLPGDQHGLAVLESGETLAQAQDQGIDAHLIGRYRTSPLCGMRIAGVLRNFGYNLIDTHNIQAKLWSSLASRMSKVAVVSTLNSWYEQEFGGSLKGRCYQSMDAMTNSRVDMFIAVSEEIRSKLLGQGVDEDRIALIPNAVSLDADSIAGKREAILSDLQIPANAVVCCCVGRLVEAKGYPWLLQAVAELISAAPNLYFVVVGGGHLRSGLETMVTELGIGTNVRLIGSKSRSVTLEYLKAADIFLLPSITEGTPVALLEAASLSKPIVASRVGGIPSILTDGLNARLVPPADAAALARGIRDLLDNPDLARSIAENARKRVEAEFSLATQIRATMATYERALERAWLRHSPDGRLSAGRGAHRG